MKPILSNYPRKADAELVKVSDKLVVLRVTQQASIVATVVCFALSFAVQLPVIKSLESFWQGAILSLLFLGIWLLVASRLSKTLWSMKHSWGTFAVACFSIGIPKLVEQKYLIFTWYMIMGHIILFCAIWQAKRELSEEPER